MDSANIDLSDSVVMLGESDGGLQKIGRRL